MAAHWLKKRIMVCDKCLCASCWHGEFMCEEARYAGTTVLTVRDLRELNHEHSSHWSAEKLARVYGSTAPFGYQTGAAAA